MKRIRWIFKFLREELYENEITGELNT